VLSLGQLEKALGNPAEVLIATADLEAGMAQLAQQRSEMGLKLFGNANSGYAHDASLNDANRNYGIFDFRAGLRYPLLGRAEAEERGLAEAETAIQEHEQRLRLARNQSLAALRRQYLLYWSTQQKLNLTRDFLAGENQQSELLLRRQQAGYLLASDYLEIIGAFDQAKRNRETLRVAQQKALNTIHRLTMVASSPFLALPPQLPAPCQEVDQLKSAIMEDYPTIQLLRHRFDGLRRQASLTRFASADASLDFYSAIGNDDSLAGPEYSIGVSFAVQLPFGRLRQGEAPIQQTYRAQIQKARQELELESSTVWALAQEALALYQASQADLSFANQRLQAATERLRESTLRAAHWEGDTLEKLQQSRYAFYLAALDYIDAQTRQWSQQINLLEYQPQPAAVHPSNGTRQDPTPMRQTAVKGFYVWEAHALREQSDTDPLFWKRLQRAGSDRLLVSLNPSQIEALAQPVVRDSFAAWLKQARSEGMAIELLLGEPLWMLPKHRGDLLKIVRALADLPFSGLHLDIEPDQLSPSAHELPYLLTEWLNSVRAVKNVSPWTLGVSLHPRYLLGGENWPDIGNGLVEIGAKEVALMIYSSNPARVMDVATAILQRYPALSFLIAQSVEPQLSSQESHQSAGRQLFEERMEQVVKGLGLPNFRGLIVQDWKFWQEMPL
jgi:outer membrane protein TolC